MTNKPATMLDVARRAGVSGATASHVLHGSNGNTRVGTVARERVLQAAIDLDYTPNLLARALRQQRTNIIGLYLGAPPVHSNTHNAFLAEIVAGLQHECNLHRKDLLIHGTFRGDSVGDVYAELISGKIDGLIIFAKVNDPLVVKLSASSVPAIALADAVSGLPSVVVADVLGSAMLANHLADKGHTHVLYRRFPTGQESANRRMTGFLEAASARKMDVIMGEEPEFGAPYVLSDRDLSILKSGNSRPTAIACSNDLYAYHTLYSCQANGLAVPDDIAIVGFDGILTEVRPDAYLTTVRAPWFDVATTAMDQLMKRIAGEQVPQETVLPVEFVQGQTA